MSNRKVYGDAVERLRDILVARARGQGPDEKEFRGLRQYVLEKADLSALAPEWLRATRTLDDWWVFIKPKFPTWAERDSFVRQEFEPLFAYVEGLPVTDEPQLPAPKSRPQQPPEQPPLPEPFVDPYAMFFDRHAEVQAQARQREAAHRPAPAPQATRQPAAAPVRTTAPKTAAQTRVFIVHGHDTNRREAVARLVEKLGFKAVVLADQPDQGRTIIEKFEAHSDVDYAVVLMTPDDVGGTRGGRSQARARQNVVLELGFFIGLLKRKNVLALVAGDLETPSDISGVLYVPWDEAGAWKQRVAHEMLAAGLPVDMNRLVR
jgi:predicted nucleotide-binding protein